MKAAPALKSLLPLIALALPWCLRAADPVSPPLSMLNLKGFGELRFDMSFKHAVDKTRELQIAAPAEVKAKDKSEAEKAAEEMKAFFARFSKDQTEATKAANYATGIAYVNLSKRRAKVEAGAKEAITSADLLAFLRDSKVVPITSKPSPAQVTVNKTAFGDTDTALWCKDGDTKNYEVTATYKGQSQTKVYNPQTSPETELHFEFTP